MVAHKLMGGKLRNRKKKFLWHPLFVSIDVNILNENLAEEERNKIKKIEDERKIQIITTHSVIDEVHDAPPEHHHKSRGVLFWDRTHANSISLRDCRSEEEAISKYQEKR